MRKRILSILTAFVLALGFGVVVADPAAASGALRVASGSPRGVYFQYTGNVITYYLFAGEYRTSVAAWAPPNGYVAKWHCAGGTSKYQSTGWNFPTPSCSVVVDSVVL